MKISNQKALELLGNLEMDKVANERNFLAPLHVQGRTASILCEDPLYAKRLIAGELGTEDIWWSYEMDQETGKLRVSGTVQESSKPIKVVS